MNTTGPTPSPHRWQPWLLWTMTGLVILGLLWWSFAPRPLVVALGTVTIGRFEQVVEKEGQLRLKNRYTIAAPASGQLQRPALQPGDIVTQNETVAWLAPSASPMIDPRNRAILAQRTGRDHAARQAASARLEQLQTALDQATLQAQRAQQLAQQNFIAPSALDQARLAQRAAEQALEAGRAELIAAQFSLAESQAALANFAPVNGTSPHALWAISSPVHGQVIKVHQTSAGPVTTGQALLEIGDPTSLEAVIDVLSSDAQRIQQGAQVKLFLDLRDEPLLTQVTRLEPAAFTKLSALGIEEQRVTVLAELSPIQARHLSAHRLGDGYRVDARISLSVADQVLLVPSAALVRDGKDWRIWSVRKGHARALTVQVKERNADVTWIEPGPIQSGDRVVLYPGKLREGQAVSGDDR